MAVMTSSEKIKKKQPRKNLASSPLYTPVKFHQNQSIGLGYTGETRKPICTDLIRESFAPFLT